MIDTSVSLDGSKSIALKERILKVVIDDNYNEMDLFLACGSLLADAKSLITQEDVSMIEEFEKYVIETIDIFYNLK